MYIALTIPSRDPLCLAIAKSRIRTPTAHHVLQVHRRRTWGRNTDWYNHRTCGTAGVWQDSAMVPIIFLFLFVCTYISIACRSRSILKFPHCLAECSAKCCTLVCSAFCQRYYSLMLARHRRWFRCGQNPINRVGSGGFCQSYLWRYVRTFFGVRMLNLTRHGHSPTNC